MNQNDQEKLTENFNLFLDRVGEQTRLLQDAAYLNGFNRAHRERFDRQIAILQWANATFGAETADITGERIRRFLEEAIELAQAVGLEQEEVENMVEYVFARPAGAVAREIGQVGVSLLALAEHLNVNAEHEERTEFERIISLPADHWQARQNAKADKGIALASTAG